MIVYSCSCYQTEICGIVIRVFKKGSDRIINPVEISRNIRNANKLIVFVISKIQTSGKLIQRIVDNRIKNQVGIKAFLVDIILVQSKIRFLIVTVKSCLKADTLVWHIWKNITELCRNIIAFGLNF
ncbi:hypothetical protein D3C86_1241580 [compost metagenome]